MNKAIIRGRSIDGTVYLNDPNHKGYSGHWYWVQDAHDASHFSASEAEMILPEVRRSFSEGRAADDIIGHIAIITAPRPLTILQRWRRDFGDTLGGYEYIMMQFGSLVNDNYEPGPRPTHLGLMLLALYDTTIGRSLIEFGRWQCHMFGHGKHWVDESYGGPDSGCDAGHCTRCGWSFHHTMY